MKSNGHQLINRTPHGFTIVELLIVIVVIGILAAITIVAFNGVTQRAKTAAITQDLENSTKQLQLALVDLSTFPNTVTAANLPLSQGTTYQYTVDNSVNPATYCLTATNGGVSYFVTQDGGAPTAGACPGHADGGGPTTITNMIPNPNIETNAGNWGAAGSSTLARDATFAHTGTAALKVTFPTAAAGVSGVGYTSIAVNSSSLVPGATYVISAYVYVPTGGPAISQSTQGSYASRVNGPSSTTSVKNTWVRLSNTFVAGTSGTISLYFLDGTAATAGQYFWIDDVMLSQGATLYNYSDGSYTAKGWTWTGTAGASASTGPVL